MMRKKKRVFAMDQTSCNGIEAENCHIVLLNGVNVARNSRTNRKNIPELRWNVRTLTWWAFKVWICLFMQMKYTIAS